MIFQIPNVKKKRVLYTKILLGRFSYVLCVHGYATSKRDFFFILIILHLLECCTQWLVFIMEDFYAMFGRRTKWKKREMRFNFDSKVVN